MLLFMVSTMGLTVDFHLCGDEIQNLAVLSQADDCSGSSMSFGCETQSRGEGYNRIPCCNDQTVYHTAPVFGSSLSIETDLSSQSSSIPDFPWSLVLVNQSRTIKVPEQPPPEIFGDTELFKRHEVFLI